MRIRIQIHSPVDPDPFNRFRPLKTANPDPTVQNNAKFVKMFKKFDNDLSVPVPLFQYANNPMMPAHKIGFIQKLVIIQLQELLGGV